MPHDLEFRLASSALKKVFSDLKYPHVLTDEKDDFDPEDVAVNHFRGSATHPLSSDEFKALLESKDLGEGVEKVKDSVAQHLASIDEYIEDIEDAIASGQDVDPSSVEELRQMKVLGDWDVEFHLAWMKVILKTKPDVHLSSPETKLDTVRVEVSATGEIWAKHPWPKCKKRCKKPLNKLCCAWRKIVKWDRLASLTLRNINLSADISLNLSVDNDFNIVSRTRYRKLRIDKDIFNKIPLEILVNLLMDQSNSLDKIVPNKTFSLEIDDFNLRYGPASINLPTDPNGLTAQVVLKKI